MQLNGSTCKPAISPSTNYLLRYVHFILRNCFVPAIKMEEIVMIFLGKGLTFQQNLCQSMFKVYFNTFLWLRGIPLYPYISSWLLATTGMCLLSFMCWKQSLKSYGNGSCEVRDLWEDWIITWIDYPLID